MTTRKSSIEKQAEFRKKVIMENGERLASETCPCGNPKLCGLWSCEKCSTRKRNTGTDSINLKLGDRVTVTPMCAYYDDWQGIVATVTGLWLKKDGKIDIEVEEDGTRYDGFEPCELERVKEDILHPLDPRGHYCPECGLHGCLCTCSMPDFEDDGEPDYTEQEE